MVLRKTKRSNKRPPSITGFAPSSSVDSTVSRENPVSAYNKPEVASNNDADSQFVISSQDSVKSIDKDSTGLPAKKPVFQNNSSNHFSGKDSKNDSSSLENNSSTKVSDNDSDSLENKCEDKISVDKFDSLEKSCDSSKDSRSNKVYEDSSDSLEPVPQKFNLENSTLNSEPEQDIISDPSPSTSVEASEQSNKKSVPEPIVSETEVPSDNSLKAQDNNSFINEKEDSKINISDMSESNYNPDPTEMDNKTYQKDSSDCDRSIPKILFAPWSVPLIRRRQTLAHVINLFIPLICHCLTVICIIFPLFWPFFIGYLFFIYQDTAPENGARALSWWRKSPLWKWYADFYPTRIVKEADLDSCKNYIFGYHPHGIIGMGAISNFATDATGVDEIFPNINIRPLTLATNFKIPFYREHLLSLGVGSVSKTSIRNILSKGPGNSCLIVVGGAEESLEAKPDRANLVLAHRYGFVKMALQCGADLVPVFGFGENQLYDQANNDPGTWIYYFQHKLKKLAGFTLPLFYGRGVFTYNLGILPHRIPLTVVTGAPIKVEKCLQPSDEQVQELHQKYLEALSDLYNRNKAAYWVGSDPPELKFV